MKEETRTILAIVICVVVITVSFMVQAIQKTDDSATVQTSTAIEQTSADFTQTNETSTEEEVTVPKNNEVATTAIAEPTQEITSDATTAQLDFNDLLAGDESNISDSIFEYKTSYFTVSFDPAGASVKNIELNKYTDEDGNFKLFFRTDENDNAFLMYMGDDLTTPIKTLFNHKIEGNKVIFYQDFSDSTGNNFTIYKTFEFKDSDYMFDVNIDIKADKPMTGQFVYTLGVGPQVGPSFNQMKNDAYNYRKVYVNELVKENKTKKVAVKYSNGYFETSSVAYDWVALAGKYFTVLAMPAYENYKFSSTEVKDSSIPVENSMFFSRKGEGTNLMNDSIKFYCGPEIKQYLGTYYSANNNEWGLKGLNLETVAQTSSWFGWLENILKWLLKMFYFIIPNYGIAIILLTFLIKLIFHPLTKKSTESTAKMAAINPQLKELQAKYKDNPQKLNQATSELYKEAHVSPLSGCLPMLIQFPIFIALYGLLNNHFELRGSMFIPGWITDLSLPDTVAILKFSIPLIGNEIHLLPIIYTVSMIFSTKLSSSASGGGAGGQEGMMKMMTYGMPLVFFFVLYSAPSGLLLYWTVQNFITMGEQKYMNRKTTEKDIEKIEKEKSVPQAVKKYRERQEQIKKAIVEGQKKNDKKNK